MTLHENRVEWSGADHTPAVRVAIVGGGASGVLMAAHLLRDPKANLVITLLEAGNDLGHGIAYSTRDPEHLLNTRAHNMSAFRDDPGHFLNWLSSRPAGVGAGEQSFVRRGTYGAYLTDLLGAENGRSRDARLRVIRQECLDVVEGPAGVELKLAKGVVLRVDHAILATGHVQRNRAEQGLLDGSWDRLENVPKDGRVVIIGSGLSMVDQVLTLLRSGHRGPILSISRRGLLPREHSRTQPLALTAKDIPLGAPMSELLHWARGLARQAASQGGTWRDAVDGIRPHVRLIWQALPQAERGRFLRHAATWWDVHRHRIPPQSQATILDALRRGQLQIVKGAYTGTQAHPQGVDVAYRGFGTHRICTVSARRVVDCRGIRRDPEKNATPLIAALLARGAARVDPLGIGLDVDGECQVITGAGKPSVRLLAIGPASRAAFWEITAVPDIREQVADLADRLTALAPGRVRAQTTEVSA